MKIKEKNIKAGTSEAVNKNRNKEDQFYMGLTGLAVLLILALY